MFTVDHAPPRFVDVRPQPWPESRIQDRNRAGCGPQKSPLPLIPAPQGDPAKAAWDVCLDWEDVNLPGAGDDYELIRRHTWLVKFADELSKFASAPRRLPVRRIRARKIPFREIALAVGLDEAWVRKFARDADELSKQK